jgi:hypothetical protein
MDIERKKMSSKEIIFGLLIAMLYLMPNLWDSSHKNNIPINIISNDIDEEHIDNNQIGSLGIKKISNSVFGLKEEVIEEENSVKVDDNDNKAYKLSEDKKQICQNDSCFQFIAILYQHKPYAIFYDIKGKSFLTLKKGTLLYNDLFIKEIDKERLLLGSKDKSYQIDIGYVDVSQFKQKDNN